MKMSRLALAAALLAFVLLVCIQLNARVACTPPLDMQSWFTGDDTVNHHIWQPVGTLYNGATYAAANVIAPSESRQLAFEDRVAYQRAIEEVYWRHRIWPNNRPDPKPSLDAVMSQATIEQKVQDYLRHSELLEQDWQKPITPEQLQAEMDRMAQHTKQPEVLRELFAALGNDPFVIAECLARPVLAERFANGDPVATALDVFGTAHPTRMPRQKPALAGSLAKAETQVPVTMSAVSSANYALPVIANPSGGCIDDTWTPTALTNAPSPRSDHTAVWTGSEMIVWGGFASRDFLRSGGRYNPSTDSWTATTKNNAPTRRTRHTAVWTGSEMIVWGGIDDVGVTNTGGRYNPITDSWTPTSTSNAPIARANHTAVWTGSEMIVWGGNDNGQIDFNNGGRYDPNTDSWTATSINNAPSARYYHTAVWTGSEMIVWGGWNFFGVLFNTGGRYNPSTDSWTATSINNAPTARIGHTAVWTDSEMIVWGGPDNVDLTNTGGRYNPITDSWTPTSTSNAPIARDSHTALWTDSEMIVWGGNSCIGNCPLNTGGRYDPVADSWTATSTTSAPEARDFHTAVWTDSEMIVWGGQTSTDVLRSGGRYCATAGVPTPTPTPTATPTPTPGQITLKVHEQMFNRRLVVHLRWTGATTPSVDIFRNGVRIARVENSGTYSDSLIEHGTSTYQVCEAGTRNCSNEVTVRFGGP